MTDAPIDFRILTGAGVPVPEFKAGGVIFRQGDDAKELFVIQRGKQFPSTIGHTPRVALNVLRVMARRLRATNPPI